MMKQIRANNKPEKKSSFIAKAGLALSLVIGGCLSRPAYNLIHISSLEKEGSFMEAGYCALDAGFSGRACTDFEKAIDSFGTGKVNYFEKAEYSESAGDAAKNKGLEEIAKKFYLIASGYMEKLRNHYSAAILAEKAGANGLARELYLKTSKIAEENNAFNDAAEAALKAGANIRANRLYRKGITYYEIGNPCMAIQAAKALNLPKKVHDLYIGLVKSLDSENARFASVDAADYFEAKGLAKLARYWHSRSEEDPKTAKHIPDNKKPIAIAYGKSTG